MKHLMGIQQNISKLTHRLVSESVGDGWREEGLEGEWGGVMEGEEVYSICIFYYLQYVIKFHLY